VLDNQRQTDLLIQDNKHDNTEVKNIKDKKNEKEGKKKNVKFSNSNAKTEMSVCNVDNKANHNKKVNNSEYRVRDRIERIDRCNYNLNKDSGSFNHDQSKESKLKVFRSKTEHNYMETSIDIHEENLDNVHELGTATKYTASIKSSKKRRSSKKSDSQQSSRKQTSVN